MLTAEIAPAEAGYSESLWRDVSFMKQLFTMVNLGLYTNFDGTAISFNRSTFVLVLYQVFMLLVQIVMLNLLIAIMVRAI